MNGAGNEARTRDLNLGKVALYQLSYSRITSRRRCVTALSRAANYNDQKIIVNLSQLDFFAGKLRGGHLQVVNH